MSPDHLSTSLVFVCLFLSIFAFVKFLFIVVYSGIPFDDFVPRSCISYMFKVSTFIVKKQIHNANAQMTDSIKKKINVQNKEKNYARICRRNDKIYACNLLVISRFNYIIWKRFILYYSVLGNTCLWVININLNDEPTMN